MSSGEKYFHNYDLEADNFDETYGINVQFEESEDDEEGDQFGEIREGGEEEEQGEEATVTSTLSAHVSYH